MDHDRQEPPTDAAEPEAEEPEVEGHINPIIDIGIADAHQQDLRARADLDRQARLAAGKDHDGGILAKIRRFAGGEDS